jgi:hypothetical protein
MAGAVTVGRPKKTADKGPPPVRNIAVRATVDWVEWVEKGAEHCRTDVSKLIDAALASYLKGQGFTDPPPKRTP